MGDREPKVGFSRRAAGAVTGMEIARGTGGTNWGEGSPGRWVSFFDCRLRGLPCDPPALPRRPTDRDLLRDAFPMTGC